MTNKTIAFGLLAAAAVGVFILAGTELAAGPAPAAQDLDVATPRQAIRDRGINFHRYGIRVAVEKPLTPNARHQRIVVRDLGPDVVDLQDDRMPGSAVLRVNGRPPIPLHFSRPGLGTATLMRSWLRRHQPNDIQVEVWDGAGNWLLRANLTGFFF